MDRSSSVPTRTLPPLELGFGNPSRSHNPSVDDRVALLLHAAHNGDVPKIKDLVERLEEHSGVSVAEAVAGAPWSKCHGPLHMAAAAGKVEACEYLIEKLKLDVNAAGTDGATPLYFAVHSSGSLAVVQLLLDRKADPNRVCSYGSTPLHIAVIQGNCKMAEELLLRGANVDALWENRSPLYMATQWGDIRMMNLLLRHKAHPNNLLQHPPLKAAIFARSMIGLKLLIKARAGVNFGRPETPLTAAAAAGLTDFVKCLLGAGADANIPDASGRIAIEIAAIQGWQECVEVLFPITAPLARVADWSIDGITQHAKLFSSGTQDHALYEDDELDYEAEGDATFDRRDYSHALTLYTMAMEIDPDNSSLYAKRSLCFQNIGHDVKALEDATTYKDMQPNLSKSCYVHRAALLLVEECGKASEAVLSSLNLHIGSEPNEEEFEEVNSKRSENSREPYPQVKEWMAYLENSDIFDRFPDISRELLQETVEILVKQGKLAWPGKVIPFSTVNEIPAESLRKALYRLISADLRNTVSVSLDGTTEQALQSYILGLAHMIFWFCTFGNMIDFSSMLRYPKILYTTPPDGTFHLIIKFEGRAIDLVIDARDAWKYAVIGDRGCCVLNPGHYITLDGVIILPYSGEYVHIAPGGSSKIRLGLEAQRDAFRILVDVNKHTNTRSPKFKAALSTFVFGYPESLKFHRAKQLNCDAISRNLDITIEESNDPTLSEGLTKWSRFCGVANQDLRQYILSGESGPRTLYGRDIAGITSLPGVLDNFLIAPYGLSQKYVNCPPREYSTWRPIDAGHGDSEVSLLGNFDLMALSGWQRRDFMRDKEKYLGNRAGGPPHWTAVNFVNSGASWNSPLPIRNVGHHFPNIQRRGLHLAACALRRLKK